MFLKKNQKISLKQIYIYLWGDSSITFNATSVRKIITNEATSELNF